jgi:hypothetical protein
MKSPMLDAFLKNQKFTDQEANQIENDKKELQKRIETDAIKQLSRSQKISEYTSIPSNIEEGDLDQVTEAHPKMKHDHSLDMPRIRMDEDGASILSDGISIPEPEPETFRLLPYGVPVDELPEGQTAEEQPKFSIDWDSLTNQLKIDSNESPQ